MSGRENYTEKLSVRLTSKEMRLLKEEVERNETRMSEYIREIIWNNICYIDKMKKVRK